MRSMKMGGPGMVKGLTEVEFIRFAENIGRKVFCLTQNYYRHKLLKGLTKIEYAAAGDNIKQEHKIDGIVKQYIVNLIRKDYPDLLKIANLCMEDYHQTNPENTGCTIMIDPVDGSRCADQKIGDPCIMFGYSDAAFEEMTFKKIKSCFIKALHSGDTYFLFNHRSYYIPGNISFGFDREKVWVRYNDNIMAIQPLRIDAGLATKLADAVIIIRDGYGMRQVVDNKINHEILNEARHTFSHDITSIELCYLTRNIVHLVIEARKHCRAGKWIGSDGFNLIPYPLVKAAGGVIYDLSGTELENARFNPYHVYDFIAASRPGLKDLFVTRGLKREAVSK
jgi:fructose-1,6-bisphosphatase/inositol monophosphatase family enzyme